MDFKQISRILAIVLWVGLIFALDVPYAYYTSIVGVGLLVIYIVNAENTKSNDNSQIHSRDDKTATRRTDQESDPETSTAGARARLPDSW